MNNIEFFRCDNYLKNDDLEIAYIKLLNRLTNSLRQIDNLKDTITNQKEKIKSLSHQINLLNRAIWRYKNDKLGKTLYNKT